MNTINNDSKKTILTGQLDDFGRVSLDRDEINPLSECVIPVRYRDMAPGFKLSMYDARNAEIIGTVKSIGTTIHTPGNGISSYRDIEIEA